MSREVWIALGAVALLVVAERKVSRGQDLKPSKNTKPGSISAA